MIAREIARFLVTALVTFLGSAAWQWWLGDPCFTQYLDAAFFRLPESELFDVCDYFPYWIDETVNIAAAIVLYVAIGFVLAGRGPRWILMSVLGGVFLGVAAFDYLLRVAMLRTDVWQLGGAYSPPGLVECVVSGMLCAAIAAGGVWLRRSRGGRA